MNCDETKTHLYTYLDREATFFRRWRVRRHLRRCLPCEDGFSFERRLKLRIRDGCAEEMPQELETRLRSFLREERNRTEA